MKNVLTAALIIFSLSHNSFASLRTELAIQADSEVRLTKIEIIKSNLTELEFNRNDLEKQLVAELEKDNQRQQTIRIRNYAGIAAGVGAVSYVGGAAVVSSKLLEKILSPEAKDKTSGGLAVLGIILAISGVVIALTSESEIIMKRSDAKKIVAKLEELKREIAISKINLKNEVGQLCKEVPNHKICY